MHAASEALNLPPVESPEDKLIRRLCGNLSSYLDAAQIAEVERAFELARNAHAGQFRLSGEPYICHPVSVAIILSDMRMDSKGVMAAILHDVIEDTSISKDDIRREFGEEVADLVDGVSKLTQLDCKSRLEAQAQNVRKMVLAMVKDLRVIMVKLADRLHNMRTLDAMSCSGRRRIARETLDIYVPIANRLGMNQIRLELEDLGFAALHPLRHRALEQAVRKARGNRKEVITTICTTIQKRLEDAHLADCCDVIGREKHLYSLYRKLKNKHVSFDEIFDVYAFRIVTDTVDQCYRVLGIVHNVFKPVPGRFKDYIALPKANGYQSLHTVLKGPFGPPMEIQIRTRAMHHMAESGIAAHWLYKSDDDMRSFSPQGPARQWLRDLLEIQKTAGDSLEFLDNLKVDLFQHEVFVFTPKGAIIKLPRGATPVDFAYAVHTDIGNTCVSARVDRRPAPLQTVLENGQTVEIITAAWGRPNPFWLNYAVTAKARAAIRSYLRNFQKSEAITLGQRMLESELQGLGVTLEDIPAKLLKALLSEWDLASEEALFEDIGLGNRLPLLVARKLLSDDAAKQAGGDQKSRLLIRGTEGMVVVLAKCCRPIPGDPIVGFFNPGKGLVIHTSDCRNVSVLRKKQVNWTHVEWDSQTSGEFPVEIRLELVNRRGTLAMVAATISELGCNIDNVQITNQDDQVSFDLITLTVRDRAHLASIIRHLRKLPVVLKISRTSG